MEEKGRLVNCLETTFYISGSIRMNVQVNPIKYLSRFSTKLFLSFGIILLG